MGYTHYWSIAANVNKKAYAAALKDCRAIVRATESVLANGTGENGTKPKYTSGLTFNGIEGDSHETFYLPSAPESNVDDFCKTAAKPYDRIVVACLCRLAEVSGVRVSSDGRQYEWETGREIAETVLMRKVQIPPSLR